MDILFTTLPENLVYNFSYNAIAPFTGLTHSEETKAKMSVSASGENNSFFGKNHTEETRAKISAFLKGVSAGANNPCYGRVGELNPMFGKVSGNAVAVYIYSASDNSLINTFTSQVVAAKFLNTSNVQVHRYIHSGRVYKGLYILRNTPLPNSVLFLLLSYIFCTLLIVIMHILDRIRGLEDFTLLIIELYEMDPDLTDRENISQLLAFEQIYLDILFILPANSDTTLVRPQALSLVTNTVTKLEPKSVVQQQGENNPMFGKAGANHPFYGKIILMKHELKCRQLKLVVSLIELLRQHICASLDNVLVKEFTSKIEAANWLNVSKTTVLNHIKSGKTFDGKYLIRRSTI